MLQDNLSQSAMHNPEHIAFRYMDQFITYEQLDRNTNQLSRLLAHLGVSRGDRVGIMLNRCMETPLAVYAILKAGAAFVPIDPAMPQARACDLIQSCEMSLVFGGDKQHEKLIAVARTLNIELTVISEKADSVQLEEENCHFVSFSAAKEFDHRAMPAIQMSPSDIAYVMFTSGSTGVPKGIVHTHESGHAYARNSVKLYGIESSDILGHHSPLHFDMSTLGYLSMPLAGGCSIIIPDAYTKLPASMSQLIQDERISIWYSVPFAIIQLLARGGLESRDLQALRWILYGGEPFAPRHLRNLMDTLPSVQISNVYGPAEVNQSTYYTVPTDITGHEDSIPIGHICEGNKIRIIDERDNLVEPGQIGELLIATSTMMQGYYRRPELNKHCFYESDGIRYYRTNDLASEDQDGLLYYHGRKDQQVKIRGNRVEIDELENLVMQEAGVEEAAAYAIEAGTDRERIEVSVLLVPGAELNTRNVLDQIAVLFPSYAQPERIVIKDKFPRTTTGKIDRIKLASYTNMN